MNNLLNYFKNVYRRIFNIQLVWDYEKQIKSLQRDIRYLERKDKNLLDQFIITQFSEADQSNINLKPNKECQILLKEISSDIFAMSDEEFLRIHDEN